MGKRKIRPCGVGGEPMFEGVLTKYLNKYSLVVRKSDGELQNFVKDIEANPDKLIKKIPLARGVFELFEYIKLTLEALESTSELYGNDTTEDTFVDKILHKLFGRHTNIIVSVVIASITFVICLALIVAIPAIITRFARNIIINESVIRIIECVASVTVLVLYLLFLTTFKVVRRMMKYHAAHHMCVNCVERGRKLTYKNVVSSSRFCPRCSTGFISFAIFLSAALFMFVRIDNVPLRLLLRVAYVPLAAGVLYEIFLLIMKYDNIFTRILAAPGMFFQFFLTSKPDDDMIQTAMFSMERVFDWREFLVINFPDKYSEADFNLGKKKNAEEEINAFLLGYDEESENKILNEDMFDEEDVKFLNEQMAYGDGNGMEVVEETYFEEEMGYEFGYDNSYGQDEEAYYDEETENDADYEERLLASHREMREALTSKARAEAAAQREAERLEAERLEAERLEAERLEAERLEAERLEAERLEAERLEAERLETKKRESKKLKAKKQEEERTSKKAGKKKAEKLIKEETKINETDEEIVSEEIVSEENVVDNSPVEKEVLSEVKEDKKEGDLMSTQPIKIDITDDFGFDPEDEEVDENTMKFEPVDESIIKGMPIEGNYEPMDDSDYDEEEGDAPLFNKDITSIPMPDSLDDIVEYIPEGGVTSRIYNYNNEEDNGFDDDEEEEIDFDNIIDEHGHLTLKDTDAFNRKLDEEYDEIFKRLGLDSDD